MRQQSATAAIPRTELPSLKRSLRPTTIGAQRRPVFLSIRGNVQRLPDSAETHRNGARGLRLIGPERLILRGDERRIDQHSFIAQDTKHVNLTALHPGIAGVVGGRCTTTVVPNDRPLRERNSD